MVNRKQSMAQDSISVGITGCGQISAAGWDLEEFWRNMISETCFIQPLEGFSCPGVEHMVGGEVTHPLTPLLDAGTQQQGHIGRCSKFALIAASLALRDASLYGASALLRKAGIIIGTTMGEELEVGRFNERRIEIGDDGIDEAFLIQTDNHRIATRVASQHGLQGPVFLIPSACSSGNAAIAMACELISSGTADIILAGGSDTFTRASYAGFWQLGALSKSTCRPFDKNRDGVTFGEGAGIVVLENMKHAQERGARIYAEIAGYGLSNDAYHITAPEPKGEGFARAMQNALTSCKIDKEEVDYICAHGTGTPYNDLAETLAVKTVFGSHAYKLAISSIKSKIGHCNGAASAIETIACALGLQNQSVPPTLGLVDPDPECDLDYIMEKGRQMRVRTCLNMAGGFGGNNVCLVLKESM